MTKRKPPGASVESWVEFQIRQAQERGDFDDLPGKGKPIADLHQPYDELWWIKRKLRDENVTVAPPAIAIRREVEQALAGIDRLHSETQVRQVVLELNAKIRRVNATTTAGPSTSLVPLDADRIVQRWQAERPAE